MADQEIKSHKIKWQYTIDKSMLEEDQEWKEWINKAIEDFHKSRDSYIRNKLIELGWIPPDE